MLVNTPPMGWNSWNTFGAKISDKLIREIADQFIKLGLDKAGYRYIVIDDCWSELERDPETGKMLASKEKFPDGMRALADYIHAKGLKFGMYSCAGVKTCANYPGSFDHEFLDAETFAEFGCDFLKYDFCHKPAHASGPLLYRRMGNALRASGRDILYSICNWGSDDIWSWARSAGAHMYRSTGDICDNFKSFTDIAQSQFEKFCFSAPQCFNDMDMLTVGMFGQGNVAAGGNDLTQYKNHFALWCIMGTPLMLGSDIRNITPEILTLITNQELIAINQDPEARPAFFAAYPPHLKGKCVVLAKMLSNGDYAIGYFNLTSEVHATTLYFDDMGFPFASGYDLAFRDVISGEDLGLKRESLIQRLEPHDCRVFRVTPVKRH